MLEAIRPAASERETDARDRLGEVLGRILDLRECLVREEHPRLGCAVAHAHPPVFRVTVLLVAPMHLG